MIISCPNCEAEYDVPDHVLEGAGRKLRCKSCTEEWHASLPKPVPEEPTPEPAAPEPPPAEEPRSVEPVALPRRRSRLPWLAPAASWAASLMLLTSAGAATLHWRTQIGTAWPPSQRLFNALPHPEAH